MRKLNVLQLTGSPQDRFHEQLSLTYAKDCAAALSDVADFLFLHTQPDGKHFILSSLDGLAIENENPVTLGQAVETISLTQPDLALPQMFCHSGMTTYRALLDLMGVPYLGNTPAAMALTFDKSRTRSIVAAAGIDVPPGVVINTGHRSSQTNTNDDDLLSSIQLPVVVKPNRGDNSMGVALVKDRQSLPTAILHAAGHCDEVLVEQFIAPGREVRCGVIEIDDRLICLPLQEYPISGSYPIRLPEDKVTSDSGGGIELTSRLKRTSCVVADDDAITKAVHELARKAHVAIGCRHYSLFDFRIDRDGQPWFLEAGLYCSFAQSSVISTMARYAGIELCELFLKLARQNKDLSQRHDNNPIQNETKNSALQNC